MNHSTKLKNHTSNNSHNRLMFASMARDFRLHGHLTTTVTKAKALKSKLQRETTDAILSVRVGRRKGDNAELMMLVSREYADKKFASKKKQSKGEVKAKPKTQSEPAAAKSKTVKSTKETKGNK